MSGVRKSAWRIAEEPSAAHREWVRAGERGFASDEWAHVIEGLGCRVSFAWHEDLSVGVLVPVFRWGPLKIAFLGFPLAGDEFNELSPQHLMEALRQLGEGLGCDLVRISRCGMREHESALGIAQPEIWIEDLESWPKSRSKAKRLDKDLAFAGRATSELRMSDGIRDAAAAHTLYRAAVLRHRGRTRYNLEYFDRLQSLCSRGILFDAVSYCDSQDRMVGFGVSARHGNAGYYLHGAAEEAARSTGVGDLILSRLIVRVRDGGASRFSLMASPADQPGLVQYKRKWGDTEGYTQTVDIGRGMLGRPLAWWLHRR